MDVSKSHFENVPLFQSVTLVIQKEGENDVLDFPTVDAEGKASKACLIQPHGGGKVVIVLHFRPKRHQLSAARYR